jgi:hypothetical protein
VLKTVISDYKPLKIRSFVAVLFHPEQACSAPTYTVVPDDKATKWVALGHSSLRLWFRPRQPVAPDDLLSVAKPGILLLGDDAEWRSGTGLTNLVNATPLRYDDSTNCLVVYTSIVGLPPVFLHKDVSRIVLASDLWSLASVSGVRLELNPRSVMELGRIGYPIGHRTLFKNTTLLPAGSKVVVSRERGISIERAWRLPDASPMDWNTFLDRQIDVFTNSVRRMTVTNSFLSLTGGLDTRTIFAVLAAQERLVPAITMSGVNPSLDARTAGHLCRAYGVPHWILTIDDRFRRRLVDHVRETSQLSGGLASLRQAPEVYFYHQLDSAFDARISGNLGNQMGRGGTEGVGTRGAELGILSPDLRGASTDTGHWFLRQLDGIGSSGIEIILQQEIPFSSVGNFSIGNYFAVQKSPYADRALVEALSTRPVGAVVLSGSLIKMRLRDLQHRFFGEPASISFQRSLLQRLGGFAATHPINYGWRATGGISPMGLLWGTAAFVGMAVHKWHLDSGPLNSAIERIDLASLHDFRRATGWLREDLRSFVIDTLSSRQLLETGILDRKVLAKVTAEHFSASRDHHETVVFALDIALAQQTFCSLRSKQG